MADLPPEVQAEVRRLMGDVSRQGVMYAAQADIIDQVAAAIFTATSATAKTVSAFATGVRNGLSVLDREVEKVHAQVAETVRNAIVEAYENSLLGTPAYRTQAIHSNNIRYAGGILRSVLASKDFVSYDSRGLYIGNTEELDSRARQWRRLNYGAGGAAEEGGRAGIVALRWSNQQFLLEEPGAARPAFRIPGGRWIGQAFYPVSELQARANLVSRAAGRSLGEMSARGRAASRASGVSSVLQAPRMTRGIRGTHWLAAGLMTAAEELPKGYTQAFTKLWKEGDAGMANLMGQVGGSRPGQPRVTIEVSTG
jgi:hypothetical protein